MGDSINRKRVIQFIFILIGVIYVGRLFYIQVLDTTYKQLASENVVRKKVIYPPRGLIYDRNDKLLVGNAPMYDIMVVPFQLEKMDTGFFCELLKIKKRKFKTRLKKAIDYSQFRPSIFLKQVDPATYARFQEHLYEFPGFYARARAMREYPYNIAAHVLGYVGEVNQTVIDTASFYESGDYMGVRGVEAAYEKVLRGQKGVKYVMVDVHNREQGSFSEGEFDTAAVEGKNLTLTVDYKLQQYGEKLMQNKRGGIVALEPRTGEVLALVSNPSFQPRKLIGRGRGDYYKKLQKDTLKPLFNRATMAAYPPGSTFKLFMALIAQQEEVINEHYGIHCPGGYYIPGLSVNCHSHPNPHDLSMAIQYSCNTYFCRVFRKVLEQDKFENMHQSLGLWKQYMLSYGLGQIPGIELKNKVAGLLPGPDYYDALYQNDRWRAPTIISLGIGQGELSVTPLQLANGVAAIANRGYYYTPHLGREIAGKKIENIRFDQPHQTMVDSIYYKPVIEGMEKAVNSGTAQLARIDNISVCGKTGTAQNPHGEDHSIFAAFAPRKKPKIVVAVYVENAGFGSTYAAPISGLMIEKYLTDSISDRRKWIEKRMLEAKLLGHQKEDRN